MPRMTATSTSSRPIAIVPMPSHMGSPVRIVRPTPVRAKTRPMSAATSSRSTTGSSGCFACRTNWIQFCEPRTWFDSFTAVRSENDSSPIAMTSTRIGSHGTSSGCGWVSFSTPSYSEKTPPTENRMIDTTNAYTYRSRPYPNGWSASAFLRALRPPSSSSSWLPESASECTPSASIELEPEKNHAMNFVIAIPRFARNAAMIAFVPPDALMSRF